MVTRLDSDVGRLLALLKELKLDEKTLVILSAGDNGHRLARIQSWASSSINRSGCGQ